MLFVSVRNADIAQFLPVGGVTAVVRSVSSNTKDARTEGEMWEKPCITSRKAVFTITAKPIVSLTSGAYDAGQAVLRAAALSGACRLRVQDTAGGISDCICVVTEEKRVSDADGEKIIWTLVGTEAVSEPAFTRLSDVRLYDENGVRVTEIALSVGASASAFPHFLPSGAEAAKLFWMVADENIAKVSREGNRFAILGISAGETEMLLTSIDGSIETRLPIHIT